MAAATPNSRQSISRVIHAPRPKIYQAFIDPQALSVWMAPGDMRLHVHSFDARPGGLFRISLAYPEADHPQPGKTTGNSDTYHGRFVELIPNEKIVEAIEFETHDPGFAGEWTMTVLLADLAGGTEVTFIFDNLPTGIRPEDNEAGTRSSLEKLAELME